MSLNFFSIGVYGTSEESFFKKLRDSKIDTFCDIRNRRSVRGALYSYANANRLQTKLITEGIRYIYVPDLSPTEEIREIQREVDKKEGVLNSKRENLNGVFKNAFRKKILAKFNFKKFLDDLERQGAKKVALFCVESDANACHRSLVTEKLYADFNCSITHI